MGNGVGIEVTEARREILRRIVVRNPGCTVKDVLAEALKVHARGEWPQATWGGARNEPYSGGISQMLDQLWFMSYGAKSSEDGQATRVMMLYAPNAEGTYAKRYYSFRAARKVLATLLPRDAEKRECEALIRRFQHEAGMDMVLGVEENGKRLVRIGTRRGIVDWKFDPNTNYGWVAAIKVAAMEVGCNL